MKNHFRDIVPPEKRSIRNISLDSVRSSSRESVSSNDVKTTGDIKSKKQHINIDKGSVPVVFGDSDRSGFSKLVLWSITITSVVAVFFVLTHFLSSATVVVTMKSWQVDLGRSIPVALSPSDDEVGYSTVVIKETSSLTIPATGSKEVSEKASGTIIIYNNFGASSQTLVSGTRFESPKGLIYRLEKSVTVPGIKKVGGNNVPGSIEAMVTADKAGQEYNIGLEDFTIPGFANTPRFEKVYARSKSSMVGGNLGKVAVVSEVELNSRVSEINNNLAQSLKDKITKELPANHIIINGLSNIEYDVSNPKSNGDSAVVDVTATMKTYLLDGNTLAGFLLRPQGVDVDESDEFVFMLEGATGELPSGKAVTNIYLNGNLSVSYKLSLDSFKSNLAGISDSEVSSIVKNHKEISEISTMIKPFWKSNIPKSVAKINVVQK